MRRQSTSSLLDICFVTLNNIYADPYAIHSPESGVVKVELDLVFSEDEYLSMIET